METPSAAPSPNLWQTLPEKLLALSMHHLARLLVLFNAPQPSNPGSTEQVLDVLLMHLGLARVTADSRLGWTRVELTTEGFDLVAFLMDTALKPVPSSSPTTSAPTPGQPSKTAASQRPAPLSLVHSRG